ncbi:unnamed protein product, partial [Cuscuta europaea]
MWHRQLGHSSDTIMSWLPGVSESKHVISHPCDICFQAKQARDSFPLGINNSTHKFELIHCDLWGSYNSPASGGAKHFLTIVDDFSRAIWVYLLVDKTEVFAMFMSFCAMVERQFSQKIKVVRSDNGTEFNCLRDFFRVSGIIFQ